MKIAICGPICSGKTYLSNYLSKTYNLQKFSSEVGCFSKSYLKKCPDRDRLTTATNFVMPFVETVSVHVNILLVVLHLVKTT